MSFDFRQGFHVTLRWMVARRWFLLWDVATCQVRSVGFMVVLGISHFFHPSFSDAIHSVSCRYIWCNYGTTRRWHGDNKPVFVLNGRFWPMWWGVPSDTREEPTTNIERCMSSKKSKHIQYIRILRAPTFPFLFGLILLAMFFFSRYIFKCRSTPRFIEVIIMLYACKCFVSLDGLNSFCLI